MHHPQAIVASCFDFSGKRDKVVYSDLNFPSVMYFWEAQRPLGARVHMIKSADGKTDEGVHVPTEPLLDAIDNQTLIVPISHVIFRSSYIQDAQAIIERRIKSAHTSYSIPSNRSAACPSMYKRSTSISVAVACSSGSAGARVSLISTSARSGKKLEPRLTGWFAHENSVEFATGPIRYADAPCAS